MFRVIATNHKRFPVGQIMNCAAGTHAEAVATMGRLLRDWRTVEIVSVPNARRVPPLRAWANLPKGQG